MKKRTLAALLVLLLLTQLLAGCGTKPQEPDNRAPGQPDPQIPPSLPEQPPEAPGPITVTDQAGREVTLDKPAETIVSCYYLVTASLLTLGQKEKIVGIEMKADTRELYRLCAPEFLDLPGVGSGKETNIEAIAALAPDLVLLPKKQLEAAETLAGLGIPTVLVEPETYASFNEMIALLGALCGCESAAADLTAYYDGVVRRVTDLTRDAERPTVYLAGEAAYLRSCAGGMYQREMIEMAGGICVSAELEGRSWMNISAEQLAAWDPEVIFVVQYAQYTLDDIRNDPALSGIRAVAENRLHIIPSPIEAWDYPQPSSILGLLWMTHILHPDLISWEDYLTEAQSFYRTYFDLEIVQEQLGAA